MDFSWEFRQTQIQQNRAVFRSETEQQRNDDENVNLPRQHMRPNELELQQYGAEHLGHNYHQHAQANNLLDHKREQQGNVAENVGPYRQHVQPGEVEWQRYGAEHLGLHGRQAQANMNLFSYEIKEQRNGPENVGIYHQYMEPGEIEPQGLGRNYRIMGLIAFNGGGEGESEQGHDPRYAALSQVIVNPEGEVEQEENAADYQRAWPDNLPLLLNGESQPPGRAVKLAPEYVVFNKVLYQKTNVDPALMPGNVQQAIPRDKPVRQQGIQPPQKLWDTPPTPRPHGQAVYKAKLPWLFDLPASDELQEFIVPPATNVNNGLDRSQKPIHWAKEHHKYLFRLLEVALKFLNRPLLPKDFQAVTEALHRQFRGTLDPAGGRYVPYLERGWNTVHTYVMKHCKDTYKELESQIIPQPV